MKPDQLYQHIFKSKFRFIYMFLLSIIFMLLFLLFSGAFTQDAVNEPTIITTEEVKEDALEPTISITPETDSSIKEISKATITVTGDILMHEPLIDAGRKGNSYNFDKFFSYIEDYINEADFAIANLETTLASTSSGYEYSGYPHFNCPDTIADTLKRTGFDLLLTANNHSNDTGAHGIRRTQQVVNEYNLLTLGTYTTPNAPKYMIQDINGIKVGMTCYTYGTINEETGKKAVNGIPIQKDAGKRINVFDYKHLSDFYTEMEENIESMKAEGADAYVLFIHWGNEYKTKQNDTQEKIAQKMCDLGIDVIVGGHPHVIQPVDLLTSNIDEDHKTLCIYSVGNAVSNQRASHMSLSTGHTEDGILFSFTFTKYSNDEVFLEETNAIPTWVSMRTRDGKKTFDILPLDPDVSNWKSTLDIDDSGLKKAKSSYDRTLKIVGDGMEKASEYLEESKTKRMEQYE